MAYTVLARKYRPQTFSDLVGQEHVTRTLGNAIGSGRVAHAFLFTGVRGVGKTTTARILAKALNCAKGSGPTSEPCGECDPCREITTGVDLDVLEIDGASNNSVEDVRRLQETIPFRPARDRFKIVIVDEVHMLSTGAFNAFLKTLEEPPPHVKFIFATTESHKVPITIRSRCQRYDFRLIPQGVVAARVRDILGREGIEADDAAVSIVAREAAGSMRDALTLLDQIVAFAGTTLVGDEVARVLGIADRDLLHRAAASVIEGDGAASLATIDALATRGLDMLHFSKALTELMRDLVVLKVAGPGTDLVALVEEERRRAIDLVERADGLELQRAFASLSLLVDEVAKASMPRLTLEMGLVRLATRPPLRALGEIVARLDALASGRAPSGSAPGGPRGGGGGGRGGGGPRPQRPPQSPDDAAALIERLRGPGARTEPAERRATARTSADADADADSEPAPARISFPGTLSAPDPAPGPEPVPEPEPARAVAPTPSHPTAPPSRPAPAPSPLDAVLASTNALFDALAPRAGDSRPAPPARASAPAPAPIPAETPLRVLPTAPAASAPSAPPAAPVGPSDPGLTERWETVVAVLMETRPALGAILLHASPARIAREEIVIAFPRGSFYRRQADAPEARGAVAEVAERVLGARPGVRVIERSEGEPAGQTIAELEAERQRARWEATKKKALNHPMVVEALSVFEARAETAEVRLEGD